MPITVTTRAGKGAPIDNDEMDDNLNSLARDSTEGLVGNTEIATQAEVTTGTDDFRYITPLKLASALTSLTDDIVDFTDHGGGQGTIDFLDGTIIVKYGVTPPVPGGTGPGSGTPTTVTYPTAFPTDTLRVVTTMNLALDGTSNPGIVSVDNFLPASFRMNLGEDPSPPNPTFNYIAIGN